MALDASRIREDFPTLNRLVNGHPLVYLDSAATSLKPRAVIDALRNFYENENSAVHRGTHLLSAEATENFESAREKVAAFVGAAAEEIVWTANTTAAINLIAYSISNASLGRGGRETERFRISPGDEIVVTEMEHHSNLVPWQELCARTGAKLRFIPFDSRGELQLEIAQSLIGERTRILAFSQVSNVLGTISPVTELAKLAHGVGALVVLDAAQSVTQLPVNFAQLGVDFAAFSGHKLFGPTGVGVLYGRKELLDVLPPFLTGGSMIAEVTLDGSSYLPSPARFEAGTPPVAEAIALATAVDYLSNLGMAAVAEHEAALAQRLVAGLVEIPGVEVLGPEPGRARAGLASFTVEGVHPHDVAQYLDNCGIAIRSGHHCAQPLHRKLGIAASSRASLSIFSTEAEVESLLDDLAGVRKYFKV